MFQDPVDSTDSMRGKNDRLKMSRHVKGMSASLEFLRGYL